MHVEQVLLLLLNSLSLKRPKLVLNWEAVHLWQEQAFNLMLDNKLIVPTSKATNMQCQLCNNRCSLDVIQQEYPNKKIRYYAICEDPIMYEQIGRMKVPAEQLNQWKISIKQVAVLIADLLGLSPNIHHKADQKSIALGSLNSRAGRKSVLLNVEPLLLVVNQSELPINQLLYFDLNSSDKLALDLDKIDHALNLKQSPQPKAYKPNVDKKEQRKANTQAMQQDWQEQAMKLKKKNPTKSKTWLSQQIAKMPLAQGKSSETIRRNINI
ncbi:MAG: hypothetical protein ACI9N3_001545 [Colwellia sp.]|jgi:hypothetical protein